MLIAFEQDHAGKLTGQVCDMDSSVAIQLIRSGIVRRVEDKAVEKPVKTSTAVYKPDRKPAKKPVKK